MLTTGLQCKRAWSFRYLAGMEAPDTAAFQDGRAGHKYMEDLVSHGTLPDTSTKMGRVAAVLEPYVRPWVKNKLAQVEVEFDFRGAKHSWGGRKDLEVPGMLIDYKFIADLKYAMTPSQLLTNPQALLYGHEILQRTEVETITLQWLYAEKKKPHRHLPVVTEMSRTHAALGFQVLENVAEELAALTETTVDAIVANVPGNYSHCGAYGGCPYRAQCKRYF